MTAANTESSKHASAKHSEKNAAWPSGLVPRRRRSATEAASESAKRPKWQPERIENRMIASNRARREHRLEAPASYSVEHN